MPQGDRSDAVSIPQFQQCLSEVDTLLQQRLHREPDSGWSDVSPSELESRYGPAQGPRRALGLRQGLQAVISPTQHQWLRQFCV